MSAPERGDLITINFNPQSGHEQAGRRPGIVLSPKAFNETLGFAVICPITNQVKGYPFEVALPAGLNVGGVILTDQLKSLDWRSRRIQIVDKAPDNLVQECLDIVHTFLS